MEIPRISGLMVLHFYADDHSDWYFWYNGFRIVWRRLYEVVIFCFRFAGFGFMFLKCFSGCWNQYNSCRWNDWKYFWFNGVSICDRKDFYVSSVPVLMVFAKLEIDWNFCRWFKFDNLRRVWERLRSSDLTRAAIFVTWILGWNFHVSTMCREISLSMQRAGGLSDILAA